MKNSIHIYFILLTVVVGSMVSCKQKNQNKYAYDANKDTIPPVLAITVPQDLDNYMYGEDIHIVGTLTDLQSRDKLHQNSGKLKSLYLEIAIVDPIPDTVIKYLYKSNPNVDGKSGFIINEKTFMTSGATTTVCRFRGVAVDYADRRDSTVAHFTIH